MLSKKRFKTNLGQDSIWKLIFKLGFPVMLAQFVNVLYSIVDRIFISNIPLIGDVALAGIGIAAPVLTLISSFSALIGLGGGPLMAMKMGEGNIKKARAIMANSFVMLLALSVLLTLTILPLSSQILLLFGASNATLPFALDYMLIYVGGSVFVLMGTGLNFLITAQGYAKISMITVLIGAVANIALDPLFIFTFNMGVRGAAVATIISQALSCAWVIGFLMTKKVQIRINFKGIKIKPMLKIFKLGLSPFLIIATDSMVILIANSVLQHTGGSQGDLFVTSATIVFTFWQLLLAPLGGMTAGCQPILSYNYGAKNIKRVKEAFFKLLVLGLLITSCVLIFAQSIPQVFVKIFTKDQEIINLTVGAIRIFTAGIVFLSIQYVCVDSLTGLGQAGLAITLSLTRKLLFMTTLIIVLPLIFGAKATFWAEPIADVVGGIVSGTVTMVMMKKILNKRLNAQVALEDNNL